MYAKFNVNRDTANEFIRLLVNRRAYSIQAHRALPNGKHPYFLAREWNKDPEKRKPKLLDTDAVRMHLNGDITINLYAINPETQRSKWVAIDGDFKGAIDALFKLQWELKKDGVEAAIEPSRRGGHLWIFADEPLLASECRIYIYNLALRLGVPIVGGGLKEGIEVFPKQDQLDEGEYGYGIRAPLGVHRRTNQRYWFYDAPPQPEAQLSYLDQVKKLTQDKLKSFIQGMSLPEAYKPKPVVPYIPFTSVSERKEFRILDYVRPTSKQGTEWVTRCPSCAQIGKDRSGDNLKISVNNPNYYRCWARCTKEQIRAALGQPIHARQMV